MSRPLRILLTDGSSLTARQIVYCLAGRGYRIDVCDPRRLFHLGTFSRLVHACHRSPSFTADPQAFLRFLVRLAVREKYHVILPVHDPVYMLSRFRHVFPASVGLPVPAFAAVERVQSKANLVRLLRELQLPQPDSMLVRARAELEQVRTPCYVKLPYGTAGSGVWLVQYRGPLARLAATLEARGVFQDAGEIVVQSPASGVFSVCQAVYRKGQLLAAHSYESRAIGYGGSPAARTAARHPAVLEHLRLLGAHLNWHGGLMVEYFIDPASGRPIYIEVNPRIGETLNACLSGINLAELLVDVALDRPVRPQQAARPGRAVRTHVLVTALLGAAQRTGSRWQVLRELTTALCGRGPYQDSEDEVTRPAIDGPSILPTALLAARLLARPGDAESIVAEFVSNYTLSADTARCIKQMACTG
jgi:predicted ATP-grasp superfamily ATP-dependent carboligase